VVRDEQASRIPALKVLCAVVADFCYQSEPRSVAALYLSVKTNSKAILKPNNSW